jgi:hypothetical protein
MLKEMNANFYDLNVWSQNPDELCLTAYEWEATPDGKDLQTNTEKFYTIRFAGLENLIEIEFLMGDLWLNSYPLTDHDTWVDLSEVYNENTPQTIRDFLENLPSYTIPTLTEGAY